MYRAIVIPLLSRNLKQLPNQFCQYLHLLFFIICVDIYSFVLTKCKKKCCIVIFFVPLPLFKLFVYLSTYPLSFLSLSHSIIKLILLLLWFQAYMHRYTFHCSKNLIRILWFVIFTSFECLISGAVRIQPLDKYPSRSFDNPF